LQLGIGLTPVARSDYKIETIAPGTIGSTNPTNGAGYGSGVVSFTIATLAASVAATITEGAVIKSGTYGFNSQPPYGPIDNFVFLRYNYSPLLISIGEQALVDTSIGV
jgi:hypothetical protein